MPGAFSNIKCAMLAAGLGKRMDPLTARHLPKPLFPLGGKVPMAEVWVRKMVAAGITDVSMNVCVLSELIKRHFTDGRALGAEIAYVEEQAPSGTLGGVCKQVAGFTGSTVIVVSGDIVSNFGVDELADMHAIHQRAGAAFTMVLAPVPWERRGDYGTVVLDQPEARSGMVSKSGRITQFVEKDPHSASNLNNASIYLIEMDLLRALDPLRTPASLDVREPFYDFGKHVFPALLGRLPYATLGRDYLLWGVEYDGAWFDVGQKRDYLSVNEHVLDGTVDVPATYDAVVWGRLGRNVSIDLPRVTIVPPVVIGHNCVIERDTTLGPYAIVGDDWRIGSGAHIEHSVLWERSAYFTEDGAEIPPDARAQIDPHEVRPNVTIRHSIVAGGTINTDLSDKTVHVYGDGRLGIVDLDWIPAEPRQ